MSMSKSMMPTSPTGARPLLASPAEQTAASKHRRDQKRTKSDCKSSSECTVARPSSCCACGDRRRKNFRHVCARRGRMNNCAINDNPCRNRGVELVSTLCATSSGALSACNRKCAYVCVRACAFCFCDFEGLVQRLELVSGAGGQSTLSARRAA